MLNAMTFDLEFWNSSEYLKDYSLPQDEDILGSLNPLLDLFNKYDVKTTFFTLGMLAEKYPDLIERLHNEGHEIASHGYTHNLINAFTKEQLNDNIKKSVSIIQGIIKEKPRGFRASHFSLTQETSYTLDILEEQGFKYGSSVFPIKVPIEFLSKRLLYRFEDAPVGIYRPSKTNIMQHDPQGKIIEVPLSVYEKFKCHIPVAGGFYLRVLPFWFLKKAIKDITGKRPAVVYIHAAESNPRIPKIKQISQFEKFVSYYGRGSVLKKLEGLFKSFKFVTVRELLEKQGLI